MDRKTLVLMLAEAVIIVALVVVIALDVNKPKAETTVASHEAATEAVAGEAVETAAAEAVTEEKAAEPAEAAKSEHKEEAAAAPAKEEKKEEPAPAKAEAAPAAAGGAGVIAMNTAAYAKHTKPIVQFTHKKHVEEYKLACGECHHNEKGEALNDLKAGDKVQGCVACHDKAEKAPKDVKGDDKLKYHANALHDNCIGCHKEYNTKNNTKAAPTGCGNCHAK